MHSIAQATYTSPVKPLRLADGRILSFHSPLVMGIVNITPDSFYDGGRYASTSAAVSHAEKLLKEGADIIDLGACSTRPGAIDIGAEEELRRLLPVLKILVKTYPQAVISVDTYRAQVALEAVEKGAHIINDISGGTMDPAMINTAGRLNVPYVLMHIKGTPATMQIAPAYNDVAGEVDLFFSSQIEKLRKSGVEQILLDPGFGFGKTQEHNFKLLNALPFFCRCELPIVAGISRKSMVAKALGLPPADALTGTITLNTVALLKGANILRVHDVKEAKQVVKLVELLTGNR